MKVTDLPYTNSNRINKNKPEAEYAIEYVYGYKSDSTSGNNLFFNPTGKAVYFTATLGIILDHESNTQQLFGGYETNDCRRQNINIEKGHNDDVTCMAISNDRSFVVTGQRGPVPSIF